MCYMDCSANNGDNKIMAKKKSQNKKVIDKIDKCVLLLNRSVELQELYYNYLSCKSKLLESISRSIKLEEKKDPKSLKLNNLIKIYNNIEKIELDGCNSKIVLEYISNLNNSLVDDFDIVKNEIIEKIRAIEKYYNNLNKD